MAEEKTEGVAGGIRTGMGILMALKDAVEETIHEARERGDLSGDRARTLVQEAVQKVQHSVGETRERLDFVSRRELDELRAEVAALREQVGRLEGSGRIAAIDSGAVESAIEAEGPGEAGFTVD